MSNLLFFVYLVCVLFQSSMNLKPVPITHIIQAFVQATLPASPHKLGPSHVKDRLQAINGMQELGAYCSVRCFAAYALKRANGDLLCLCHNLDK